MAINKDGHARIIIMRPEITLHSEAGYIFADCSRRNRFFLQFGGGPYMLRQSERDRLLLITLSAGQHSAGGSGRNIIYQCRVDKYPILIVLPLP